jgi:4'-phosphopantetheinyl transferase
MPNPHRRCARLSLVQVRFIRLAELGLDCLAPLRAWLSPVERSQLARLHQRTDQHRYLLGHAALRHALGQTLGLAPDALAIVRDAQGKPRLAGAHAGLHFNLSHSGDWVALAWSQLAPVGVDIEARANNFAELLPYCANPTEQVELRADPRPERAFLQLWTRKEAVLKAHGSGLSVPMDQIVLQQADAGGWLRANLPGAAPDCLVQTLAVDTQHAAAVALVARSPAGGGPDTPPTIELGRLEASALLDPHFSWSQT